MRRLFSTDYVKLLILGLVLGFHATDEAAIKGPINNLDNKSDAKTYEEHGMPAVLPVPTLQPNNENVGVMPGRPNRRFHFNFSHDNLSAKISHVDQMELLNQLSTLTPMPMDELQPPDHMDGVRVEQDGDLNTKYRKEILLGEHDEFDSNIEEKVEAKIKEIFHLADKNKDDFLDTEELNEWMIKKVKEHVEEAKRDNDNVFEHLDIDKDGKVTWTEFSIHFLLAKGYSLAKAINLSSKGIYDDIAITPEEKEKLIRYKFRWAEADEGSIDGQLDKVEMMNFRHPEQSPSMIKRVATDLLENFDINEDNKITEDEFVNVPAKFVGDNLSDDQKKERKREYENYIDMDGDGVVTIEELKLYVDPRNLKRLWTEAENLISLADEDGDNKLSLKEVLENSELFLGSKMFDASRNFHDEF